MAPGGGGKRKRGDRTYSHDGRDEGSRPSPHRPGNLNLGQQSNQQQGLQSHHYGREQYDQRGGGRRRASRGGRGGGPQRSPVDSPNAIPLQLRPNNISSKPMSPTFSLPQPSADTKLASTPQPMPITNTSATQTPEEKPANPTPYDYEYITDEKVGTWTEAGRQDVVDTGTKARMSEDPLMLGLLFQEVVRSGLDGRIDAKEAGSIITEIIGEEAATHTSPDDTADNAAFDASSLFLDCISILAESSSPAASLKTLVLATGISPLKIRRELDSTLLENLGMIRNTFVRVGIRQQTNSLYRQSNYNLLREETEGYSKLITELFTTSSNEPPTSEVVEETFERVKGMIGAFDLDVGRVLDITLDVFAAVLVKQYRFFVKYLRASSWWPQDKASKNLPTEQALGALPRWALPGSSGRAMTEEEKEEIAKIRTKRDQAFWQRSKEIGMDAFFEIGDRRAEDSALKAATANGSSADSSRDDGDREWIETTNTLPPPGNKVAAQVLGFKLRFYSSSARDPTDVLPVNLIYLAALLIKVGFISLRDLYPHIWPADTAMEAVRDEKMKEKAEREKLNRPGGGAANALMAAAPLPDDSLEGKAKEAARLREIEAARRNPAKVDLTIERSTPTAQPEEKAEDLPEPSEQKVQLLKSLLCIGALPEALYMLGRFPWLPDAFPDLPEHIHRILHHSISKVYEPLRPLKDHTGLREQQRIPDPDQSAAAKGEVKLLDAPARKTMRWAQLDKEDTNEAIDYRFYWDDWADSIPVCQTINDVFTLCSTLLNYSGVKIGQDTSLLIKLSRIGNHSLAADPSDSNVARWVDLSKRLLVPALSFTKCNPGVVNEVFELIKNFSTPTRYSIYAEWYSGQVSRLPDIKSAFDQAKAETKDVLKRISKTTIKPMARALAKVAYASPGIVFSVAIAQLESYENIVDAVVECARYFTYLAYDVLTWSLMSSLGGTGRNRVQSDGMLTSKWLAALSLFAGKVFKRYSVMNPTPIIQYVADQLRQGNSTDLIILEEMTKSMAGLVSDTNFNEAQVLAMAGGDLLQGQTMLQLLDRRHESKTTARRLMKSLTDSRLAGQVLISLAQERQTGIYKVEEQNAHPKLLGNIFDQLHRILVQYLELLRSNLSVKDFDYFVPGVSSLVTEYGIDPSIAFWISRPSIVAGMADYDAQNSKRNSEVKKSLTKETTEDTIAPDQGASDESTNTKDPLASAEDKMDFERTPVNGITEKEISDLETADATDGAPAAISSPLAKVETAQQLWHPVLLEIMEAIRPTLPEETWEILSQPFYVTFWQLSLRDMLVPLQSYDDEVNRQKRKVLTINSDRSDISILGTQRKDREKKILTELQDRLREESKDRIQAYQQTRSRLQKEKEHWFSGLWGKWDALNVALIEHCFFPRILISPVDAMYAFKMLKYLHSSGATNFRTMGVLDQLFVEKRLTSMMFICTAKQAECFGRFLNEVLRDLGRWHADKTLFEKEAFGPRKDLPGFSKKLSNDKTVLSFWDYEEFRRVLLKWHRNLNSALKTCIGSGEYMHIRNAINILNNVNQYFPAVNWMGRNQLESISDLSRSESREDLKIAAMSLIGALKRREKDWMLPQAFSLNDNKTENGTGSTNGIRSSSAKPSTPRSDGEVAKTLNPNAPEFQPSPHFNINAVPKAVRTVSGKLEVEDGEIEDAKLPDGIVKESAIPSPAPELNSASVERRRASAEPAQSLVTLKAPSVPGRDLPSGQITHNAEASPVPTKSEVKPQLNSSLTPSVPMRQEVNRNVSSSSANGRVQHTLPSRPEAPQTRIGDHRMPPRLNDRGPHDYARDSRYPRRDGPERSRDLLRDRGSEHSSSGPHTHGHDRPSERAQPVGRDRLDLGWGNDKIPPGHSAIDERHSGPHARDPRPLPRDDRSERIASERQFSDQGESRRDTDALGQPIRDTAMAPPRSKIPQHPDRAALIQGSQISDPGHPANSLIDRRSENPKHDIYTRAERSPRGSSPGRADDRRPRYENHHDDRQSIDGRRPVEDITRPNYPRVEEPHAPTGPRTGGRPANAGPMNANERFKDSMKGPSNVAPPLDPNHGRLNLDSSHNDRQSESQYGRLNSSNDIPSGPRLSNGNQHAPGRGSRNLSAVQHPQINTQVPTLSSQAPPFASPVQDRHTPSGPSMRGSQRNHAPLPHLNATSSAPPTPVAQSPETAGIHPDRLKAIQGSGAATAENGVQNRGDQNRGSRQGPLPIPMPAPAPPRGPNNQLPSPGLPSPTNRDPPTGPSFPNDRNRGDKRFAGIQNVLQQAGPLNVPERAGQGAIIRGRGGRANNINMPPSSTPGPPTPNLPRHDALPPRGDLFAGRPNGPPPPQKAEDDGAYGRSVRRGGPRENARDGERRSGRHRSRSPGKERSSGPQVRSHDEEVPQGRNSFRDRPRGNEGSPGGHPRGTGGPERDPRDGGPPRDTRRSERDVEQYRERRGESDQRDGPDRRDERDRRDGGGSGRKRGRGVDEGHMERGHTDNKRPRR